MFSMILSFFLIGNWVVQSTHATDKKLSLTIEENTLDWLWIVYIYACTNKYKIYVIYINKVNNKEYIQPQRRNFSSTIELIGNSFSNITPLYLSQQ